MMQRQRGILYPKLRPDGSPNAYWPLPWDYTELTADGRKLARVNACMCQQTPETAVLSWQFFCEYYLRGHDNYDPLFYEDWKSPARFHLEMIRWFESFQFSAMAFPRGGGKTTTIRSYALFKAITTWQFFVNLYVSKFTPFVTETMDIFKSQLTENKRLLNDFGRLAPIRGKGVWSASSAKLTNGSRLRLWSFDGGLRGARGHFMNADDIEKDPTVSKPDPDKIMQIRQRFMRVIMPTLRYGGTDNPLEYSSMSITGTLIHQQCLLNHILTCDDPSSADYDKEFRSVERGGYWKKINLANVWDNNGHSVWPEMWTDDQLHRKAEMMSASAWASEFGGNPISDEEPLFFIDNDRHEYRLTDIDEYTYTEPFRSNARVSWNVCKGYNDITLEPHSELWRDKINGMIRGITVDVATGLTAGHDFSVVHVIGLDHNNDLWSLDLWQERVSDAVLIRKIWEYAIRWHVSIIGIEAVGLQEQYFHAAQEQSHQMLETLGWVPQMRPITHGTIDKGLRIKRLEWRWNFGRIKYPRDRRNSKPYADLYLQTVYFTPDLANLKHDDCIDTMEMGQTLLKGQRGASPIVTSPSNFVERMLAGETKVDGTNVSLASFVGPRDLPRDLLEQILQVRRAASPTPDAGDVSGDLDAEFDYYG